jgi:hypothetical protein
MEKVKVKLETIEKMKTIKNLAVDYEQLFSFERRLGITGELGEILLCYLFDLDLVKNNINDGFDALDKANKKIQIKSIRKSPSNKKTNDGGRLSRFSEHEFDYCLLISFDKHYSPTGVWKANKEDLGPIIAKHKRRNPTVREFKNIARQIEIPTDKIKVW